MKILFIIDGLPKGGRERRCIQLIKGLVAENIDVHLMLTREIVAYKEIYDIKGCTISINNKSAGYFKMSQKIVKYIKNNKPDIVQCWIDFHCPIINIIKPFSKFIYITSFIADCNYFTRNWLWKIIDRWSFYMADVNIGNSKAGIEAYGSPHDSYVMYNGFDMSRIQIESEARLGREINPNNKYIISMIARMVPNKDYQMFIDAARLILTQRNDVIFLCVGGGEDLDKYTAETVDDINIRVLGQRSDVEELLLNTHISVLCTSSIHKEGISNTILESMAFKKPVVATFGGGTSEIVNDGDNGFLVKEKDYESLAQKLQILLADKVLYQRLSNGAYDTIVNRFTLEKSTSEYIELYDNLLSKYNLNY